MPKINEIDDICDYLNELYAQGGEEKMNFFFLPAVSEKHRRDYKALVYVED